MKRVKYGMRNNLLTQFLIFYLAILLIPVTICGAIYWRSYHLIKEEINNVNVSIINKTKQTIENQISILNNTANLINYNTNLLSLIYKQTLSTSDQIPLYHFQNELQNIGSINSNIDDIYVYLRNSDFVIYQGYSFDGSNFFTSIAGKEWQHPNMSGYHISISSEKPSKLTETSSKSATIVYYCSLPLNEITGSQAYIAIYLDPIEILHLMESDLEKEHGDFYIIDDSGGAIYSGDNKYSGESMPNMDIVQTVQHGVDFVGTQGIRINRENYVISQALSTEYGLHFLSVTPSELYNRKLYSIRLLYLFSIFLCLLCGSVLAVYFSRKNYNPIKDIIESFHFSPSDVKNHQNELELIKSSIDSIMKEYDIKETEISKHKELLRNTFITNILQEPKHDSEYIYEGLKYFGISLECSQFGLLLLNIDTRLHRNSDSPGGKEEANSLINRLVVSEISMYFNDEIHCIAIDTGDGIACIMNFDSTQDGDYLKKTAEGLITLLKNNYDISATVAVSKIHTELHLLNVAYREAINAREYMVLESTGAIISFDDIKSSYENKFSQGQSLDEIHQMINKLKVGEVDAARTILKQIIQHKFHVERISIPLIKCRMSVMIDAMISAIDELPIDVLTNGNMSIDKQVDAMFSCESISDLQKNIEQLFDRIELYFLQMKNEKDEKLLQNILAYIEKHYKEYSLNVSTIADYFNLNIECLSRFFKKKMNNNLLSYINVKRIKSSEDLLRDPDISIKLIAEKVGFSNSDAFIRVHKKIMGITPGKLRLTLMRQSKTQ